MIKFSKIKYVFKNKIQRTYRIDKVNKKLIMNLLNFLKENREKLKISDELIEFIKKTYPITRENSIELNNKFPNFKSIYDEFLKSDKFKKIIMLIKTKYDEEYLKLFFRHTKNFLSFHLLSNIHNKTYRRIGVKNTAKS